MKKDKNISKSLSVKYNQKTLDYAKQSSRDGLKTFSERVIQKIPEATGDSIGDKFAKRIVKVSKNP